ncbi:YmdB family metallophosphoesterase [candidate division WWE3 bacterium]|uniref:YmdB family metallophosphoesterase n=2 Tax=candidate division WWE3 bacterium TaxID=2053526 RepID=A0A955RPT2_UNCKA|nr:YmdB family metallophosphoesterase [candidate division WWE3 bacterium]
MKILLIGDIVSRLGRKTVSELLPSLKDELSIDFVIANAENLAGGRGATVETLDEMMQAGVDYFTSGDHIFWGEEVEEILEDEGMRVLRPANFPNDVLGRGCTVIETDDYKLGIINLIGKTFETPPVGATDVFRKADEIIEDIGTGFPIVVDIHSEFTSEKVALAYYLAGRVSMVAGTHTHVGTIDARILENKTGFVTDLGMVGPYDSVIGVDKNIIIQKSKYPYPQKFEWVKTGTAVFNAVLVEVDNKGKCVQIDRVDRIIP